MFPRLVAVASLVLSAFLFQPVTAQDADDWRATSSRVDELLAAKWKVAVVEPGKPATDAQFLRRAYLDLTGVIPSPGEVRAFLADDKPNKRARLIEKLLDKPNHATHLANAWRDVMLPRTNNNNQLQFGRTAVFDRWLRGHFVDNTPYDKIVRELLTTGGQVNQTGPVLYYTTLELKPEKLAASTSEIFLGVQIQCAQCHDHPFDKWKQKDFWGYAAFFARLQQPAAQQRAAFRVVEGTAGEVKLPDSDEVVPPKFLDAKEIAADSGIARRVQLADWITSPENPYFARATVNRAWSMLFGYGLVDPVDDFGDHNPPSHPKLLDELAADFAEHDFNLRRLFRVLANTRAYSLTSEVIAGESVDPRLFSRMSIKSLSPEQVYDCLSEAVRLREAVGNTGATSAFGRQLDQRKQAFLAKFEAPAQRRTEFQSGIPQALTMMNGQFLVTATDVSRSDILAALIDASFFTNEERVEVLFLSALARFPEKAEREKFVAYVKTGGPTKDSKQALSDVLWALLNSSEFMLNH
ncbi:MAG: DUF1553 domain-containing protein [Planctomycetaceae bacterium]|jgi:hypothetical protein|nr:DUF1553 domain-containing protein [Planctomycetaceae bacterium]MBT6484486.1 DUF1553 domain-containing protein [Planctomycetaceae bacterium]MBT6498136.1 DUF1553 domain-containing protein [Planctomycetaceae bacterium]